MYVGGKCMQLPHIDTINQQVWSCSQVVWRSFNIHSLSVECICYGKNFPSWVVSHFQDFKDFVLKFWFFFSRFWSNKKDYDGGFSGKSWYSILRYVFIHRNKNRVQPSCLMNPILLQRHYYKRDHTWCYVTFGYISPLFHRTSLKYPHLQVFDGSNTLISGSI